MTRRNTRRAKKRRKGNQKETTEETTGQETRQTYTKDDVLVALDRVCEHLRTRAGRESCLNIDNKVTGTCSCVFQILYSSTSISGRGITCDTMCVEGKIAAWFRSTSDIVQESLGMLDPVSFLTGKYVKCMEAEPVNNGQQYTKLVYMDIPLGNKDKRKKEGNWNGHDWDVGVADGEEYSFYPKMCVPSVLLLWKALVGGGEWESKANAELREWRGNNYQRVLVNAGVIAEQICKQKMRQRLFYSRLEDYMDSHGDITRIPFERAFAKYKEMRWIDMDYGLTEGNGKKRLARCWDQWNLSSIHIVRAGSNMLYQKSTRDLFLSLKMEVRNIKTENMDFLEELFLYVMESSKEKAYRVAKDKKLLYKPFETCTDVQSAIGVNYGDSGDDTLTKELRDFVKNDDYKKRVELADDDITKSLLDMINSQREVGNYNTVAYQTSLLFSEVHHPQEAHVDYDTATENPQKYLVAFLPLTETGQFLQFWNADSDKSGEIVFIPRGQLLLVPGGTIHGGGFRADHRTDNMHAHMRLHFYVYPGENRCLFAKNEHKNDYLANLPEYVQHPELDIPEKGKQGIPMSTLGNSFFHGHSE
jgi:hypothetical protein